MNAIIYIRVSTKEQLQGYSLTFQERECKSFAERENLKVVKVFAERGESAKTAKRPELQKLLEYITENKKEIDVVIVHKIDRLSRNVYETSNLRLIFSKLGIELKSATEHFDNTAVGKLTANLLSSMAQFDNDVRSERTSKGMKEALLSGRWVHIAPFGYKNQKDIDGKPNLIQDENAAYIRNVFKYFNQEALRQTEIVKKLKKDGLGRISKQFLNKILNNSLYAGIIEHKFLDKPVKALFEPIISEEEYYKAQKILNGKKRVIKPHLRINPDFPLRNFVKCPYCNKTLTGSWSTGRNRRYAYYHCVAKGCEYKSVKKEELERDFIKYLKELKPKDSVIDKFCKAVETKWKEEILEQNDYRRKLTDEIKKLEDKRERINELVINGTFDRETYKEQIGSVEGKIAVKKIELSETEVEVNDINTFINYCNYFIKNISKLWVRSDVELKIQFQNIIFPEGIYYKDGIIGTTKIATIFEVLRDKNIKESTMVAPSIAISNRIIEELIKLKKLKK